MMKREQVLQRLQQHAGEIRERFAIEDLAVFGSIARDEATDDSDVDVLATFKGGATFDGYFGLKGYLENLLGVRVDLATPKMVKPRLWGHIQAELVHVA